MPSLEAYVEHADELVQEVYNAYGVVGRSAPLTREFSALLDKAYIYRTMSRLASNHRELNLLTEQEKAELRETRQAFSEAYKTLWEKHIISAR